MNKMSYQDLINEVNNKHTIAEADIKQLIKVCDNVYKTMAVYYLSCKFCKQPSIELIELAIKQATPEQICEIIEAAAEITDKNNREKIINTSIIQYDSIIVPRIKRAKYGNHITDYGLGNIVNIYNTSLDNSKSREVAIEKIIEICRFLLSRPYDCTERRIQNIINLQIVDVRIAPFTAKAVNMLNLNKFQKTE